ncbi:MAG: P-loop NTPase fold protein [Bacteroidia bacterium]
MKKSIGDYIGKIKWNDLARDLVMWFFLGLLVCLFNQLISGLIEVTLVKPIWAQIHFNVIENLVIFILWNLVFVAVIYNFFERKYYPKSWVVSLVLFAGACYIMFRFFITPRGWSFYHFTWPRNGMSGQNFCYTDVILLVFVAAICYRFDKYRIKETSYKNKSIFSLENSNKEKSIPDKLRRTDKAEFIAGQIRRLESLGSFAIGIIGPWGSGKSYFIRQITERLEKDEDKINVVWFTPWQASGKSITQFFIETLHHKLSGEVSNKLSKYAKWLHQSANETKFGAPMLELFKEDFYPFDEVNEAIKRSEKKNVIVLDDIDRLDEDEIVEVCRIIRNTANFNNTIYIMAYDKDYVVSALEKVCNEKAQEYLGKIIQFQYYLPKPPKHALLDKFRELIIHAIENYNKLNDDKISESVKREIENMLSYLVGLEHAKSQIGMLIEQTQVQILPEYFTEFILTIRDTYTLTNSYLLNFIEAGKFEIIDAQQLLFVELLKLKCSRVYISLRSKELLKPNSIPYELDESILKSYLSDKCDQVSPETVSNILKELFSKPNLTNSIASQDHFEWYFDGNTNVLTPKERFELREERDSALKAVTRRIAKKKEIALIEYINVLPSPDSAQEFIRFITISVSLYELSETYRNSQALQTTLSKIDNVTINEIVKSGIVQHFDILIYQYPIEISNVLSTWILERLYGAKLPAIPDMHELKKLVLIGLEQVIDKEVEYNIIEAAYSKCIESIDVKTNILIIFAEANVLMRTFVQQNPAVFIKDLIRPIAGNEKSHAINSFAEQIFALHELRKFLNEQPVTSEIVRIKHFLNTRESYGVGIYDREKISIESDVETRYVHNATQTIQPVTFTHIHHKNYVKEHSWLIGMEDKYLAHAYPIPDEEASIGGVYKFSREIDLGIPELFNEAILRIWADDFCALSINGNSVIEEIEGFHIPEIKLDMKDFRPGINELIFVIRNRNAMEANNRPTTNGYDNPYALVYRLDFVFKEDNK